MIGKFKSFLFLSFTEKMMLLEAVFWLTITPIIISMLGLKRMGRLLGAHMEQTSHMTSANPIVARKVSYFIRIASRNLPWTPKCLAKAICCKQMLFHRGLESTLYLGVAKKSEGSGLKAHAWLRCGTEILTGGRQKDDYIIVSTFGKHNHHLESGL